MCVYLSMAIEKQNQKCASCFNYLQLCATPWTAVCQVPLSMEFSRQEYWNVLPFPTPGDLADPVIKPMSLMSPALAGRFLSTSASWGALVHAYTR